MKRIVTFLFCLSVSAVSFSQTDVAVDPNSRYQTMEGWGVSLAWWANVAGGWSDAKIDTLCTWLTSPSGLNMNVFRFNIGGGENPSHDHFRPGAGLQGYKVSESAAYDFTRDETQRKILLKIKSKRNDCIFEAISYSPPYWMTYSGCTAGNTGAADNLKDDYYDDFADYLTEVVKYYHDNHNITFRTIAPVNEPVSGFWAVNGNQEGCGFSTANQVKIINEVYDKLQAKGMTYCTISAMDANVPSEAVNEINGFVTAGIVSKISQINTHGYTSLTETSSFQQLRDLAKTQNKKVWQSETGPLVIGNYAGFQNNLYMTDALIRDMRHLRAVAWCDWQYANGGPAWGHIDNDTIGNFKRNANFFARSQVTRFIKPGYTIIGSSSDATLAALNPENNSLVLVVNNSSLTDKTYKIDLNLFASTGSAAQVYRTTEGKECAHWNDSAYNVYTYQVKSGLTNGTYTAKAWVRSSGGQTKCYLEAKNFGGTTLQTNITQSFDFVQVTISNITVTNGQCTIGVYSEGPKNTWCAFDDIEFYLNSNPAANFITNPGFESDVDGTQSPAAWSTGGSSAVSDFTQWGSHGNNEKCKRLSDVSISSNIFSFTAKARSVNTFVVPVTLASASPLANGNYRITAKHSNKDMSVAGWSSSDGAVMEQWTPLSQSNQVFNVQYTASGYKIMPSYNAKVVTVNGNSSSNGAAIKQWSDSEQTNQRFSIIDVGGGYYKIAARNSGKCLAVTGNGTGDGDDVIQWEWMNYDNAKWQFTPVTLSVPLANGTYTIKAKHSSKVMSIAGWSSSNGVINEQWDNLCQGNEKFVVTSTSSGYTIMPSYNTKVLSVNNSSSSDGATTIQSDDFGDASQRFEIVSLGSGYYRIIARHSNKCLAVSGSGTNNGDDVVQWEWIDADNFKWSFETPCTSGGRLATHDKSEDSIEDVGLSEHFEVYPNPASGYFQVRYSGMDNPHVIIYNINGSVLLSEKMSSNQQINMVAVPKGLYLLKASGNNKTAYKKILVQ